MNDPLPEDLRSRIEALVSKARGDDTFAFRLREDPEAILAAEGFSGEALATMSHELGDPEVEGYLRWYTCDIITCIFTGCANWTNWP